VKNDPVSSGAIEEISASFFTLPLKSIEPQFKNVFDLSEKGQVAYIESVAELAKTRSGLKGQNSAEQQTEEFLSLTHLLQSARCYKNRRQ